MKPLRVCTAVVVAVMCFPLPAAVQPAADFYAGKQIVLIVGAGIGGGYDLQARLAARHLGKHIPGRPAIIVQNMPARIAAANHMFTTAAKDGTAIALLQRGILLAKLIYPSGVRFEIEKFNWLGSLNTETAVTLAWHTAPHKSARDLFERELIVGGITGVDPETTPKLYNSLIGTRFKVVSGYNSTAGGAARPRGTAARRTRSLGPGSGIRHRGRVDEDGVRLRACSRGRKDCGTGRLHSGADCRALCQSLRAAAVVPQAQRLRCKT